MAWHYHREKMSLYANKMVQPYEETQRDTPNAFHQIYLCVRFFLARSHSKLAIDRVSRLCVYVCCRHDNIVTYAREIKFHEMPHFVTWFSVLFVAILSPSPNVPKSEIV